MAVKQFGIRLKAEGGPETVQQVKAVETAIVHGADASDAANARAAASAERLAAKYAQLAQTAQASASASQAQSRFNAVLGVDRSAPSARDSASVFAANDDQAQSAAKLKAILNPLAAAQDNLNDELREYETLARAGKISTEELARAQVLARTRFDETARSIQLQDKGLSKQALAGRLNLARQGADVFTTAAMGMNPGMIAIQQGPQILDALATSGLKVGPAMIAAGGAVALLAGAVVALGVGWAKGEASALGYERAVSGMGRTAQLSSGELRQLVMTAAEQGEVSIDSAQKQATAYLQTGRIGRAVLVDLISVGKDYAAMMGLDAKEATKSLADAMQSPDKAGRDLTRTMGLLTQEQLRHIDSLVKSGDLLAAQRILLDAVSDAAKGHSDNVGVMTNAWDALGASISNAITKFGEWLYRTDEENLATLDAKLAKPHMGGRTPEQEANLRASVEKERTELAFEIGYRNAARENAARQAAANQRAQQAKDRYDSGASSRRSAAAEAAREAREAEQARKEALARARREEDASAARALTIARATGNTDQVRQLEDANAVRTRERQLIDDGLSAERARTKALAEQVPLIEARRQATARDVAALSQTNQIEVERIKGNERSARQMELQASLTQRIAAYAATNLGSYQSMIRAVLDLTRAETARAEVVKRNVDSAELERQARLASLRGDDVTARGLDRQIREAARAREIEGREGLNYGDGNARAKSEIEEETRAALTGARRGWAIGLAQDIRQSGIKNALANQLDRAGDKLIENLVDGLMKVKWGDILSKASGGGDEGGWLSKGLKFATSLFGKNAEGTDDWGGGLTWVGERGKELVNLPKGSQVLSHGQSLAAVQRGVGSGGRAGPTFTWSIDARGAGPNEIDRLEAKMDGIVQKIPGMISGMVPGVVNDGIKRRTILTS